MALGTLGVIDPTLKGIDQSNSSFKNNKEVVGAEDLTLHTSLLSHTPAKKMIFSVWLHPHGQRSLQGVLGAVSRARVARTVLGRVMGVELRWGSSGGSESPWDQGPWGKEVQLTPRKPIF